MTFSIILIFNFPCCILYLYFIAFLCMYMDSCRSAIKDLYIHTQFSFNVGCCYDLA